MTLPDLSAALALADDWHGPGWWILFVPIVWFAVAFVFFGLLRRFGRGPGCGWGGPGPGSRANAAEILDRRFAAGDIDEGEYRSRRSSLGDRGEHSGGAR